MHGRERGGFTEASLRRTVRDRCPGAADEVDALDPERRADFYDKLGRAYAAALDRALAYAAANEGRQA